MKCSQKDYLNLMKGLDRDELMGCAQYARDRASVLAERSIQRARSFSIFDFAVFKVALVSFGVLIGSVFAKFFRKYRLFVLLGLIASYAYLIWRVFFREED